jgi:hypothetical protein
LTLVVVQPDNRVQRTVLQVKGVLDRRTAEAFITCAADLYDQGCRQLIIDLQATTRIELSGAFALHNIARLYSGEAMLNPEDGWEVLRRAAVNAPTALGERVKLLAPPPAVALVIGQASACQVLEVYADLASAVAAFQDDESILCSV